jgi:RHS repeat-associated protein
MEKNSQSFYYHADGLGSITELTNQSGAVVQRYTYSSFGKIESELDSNFAQPYVYTSRELDQESGLSFYRTRNYDSSAGRFFQPDPIRFSGGPSFYTYAENNPLYFVDPLGLDAVDVAANVAAGLGDVISLGLTNYIRNELGTNSVVDQCSTAYYIGWWSGMLHQLAFSGIGAFNGAARTVLYSGEGALEAARLAKGAGRLLEDTLGGQVLNFANRNLVTLPDSVWKVSSGIFGSNAKGEVAVFIRNANPRSIYNTVEAPVLNLVNRVNSSVIGQNASTIILR